MIARRDDGPRVPKIRKQSNGYFCTWRGRAKYLARTEDKAKERLRVLLSDDNPDQLSVWIDRYLESVKNSQSSETIREKRFHYLEFLRFSGDVPASEVTTAMVSSYLDSKRKTVKDISLKSKVVRLAVLLKFMGRTIAMPKVRSDYTGDSKLPVNGSVDRLYSAVTNPRDRVILDLARFAGLRRKEIALMEWRDVDLAERTIFVRHTKGYRSRTVPFGERLWVTLSSYDYDYGGRLFQLQPNGVSQVIKRLSDRAGVRLHIHQLRHLYATELLRRGVSIRVVQELLGHHSVTETQRYCAVTDKDRREAAEKLG